MPNSMTASTPSSLPTQSSQDANKVLSSLERTPLDHLLVFSESAHILPTADFSKKPRFKWINRTRDPKTISGWYKKFRHANFLAFFSPDSLCVVDIDVKDGKRGLEHAKRHLYHIADVNEWARLIVRTPSCGYHCYHGPVGYDGLYLNGVWVAGKKLDLDVRSNLKGYAVLPGAIIKGSDGSYRQYSYLSGNPTADELRAILREVSPPPKLLLDMAAGVIPTRRTEGVRGVQNLLTTATATVNCYGCWLPGYPSRHRYSHGHCYRCGHHPDPETNPQRTRKPPGHQPLLPEDLVDGP